MISNPGSKAKGLQVVVDLGANTLGRVLAQLAPDRTFVFALQYHGQKAGLVGVFVYTARVEMVEYVGDELAVEVGLLLLACLIDKGTHGVELEDALPIFI